MAISDRISEVCKSLKIKKKELYEAVEIKEGTFFYYQRNDAWPASFFQSLKKAYPRVNLNYIISGVGYPVISEVRDQNQRSSSIESLSREELERELIEANEEILALNERMDSARKKLLGEV